MSVCTCPFCAPSRSIFSVSLYESFSTLHWHIYFIALLLLLGPGCEARRLTRTGTSASSDLSTIYNAQKFDIKASELPACTPPGSCNCVPVGKCKPCSRIDIYRQMPECLVSGFKQRSYCGDTKQEKYISCHYVVDPREVRLFWLFEGSVFSVGVLAYAVVVLRTRKIERLTARRIQEQINA